MLLAGGDGLNAQKEHQLVLKTDVGFIPALIFRGAGERWGEGLRLPCKQEWG